MDPRTDRSPISFQVHVRRLPKNGLPVVIDASEKQRVALASAHHIAGVERLTAEMLVTPWKRNGVEVTGTVTADIVQECVVTLEPLSSRIAEAVSAVFIPEESKLGREGFSTGGEILIEVDGPDSPETFSGDTIDVGALAEEFFGLAIDPYPRKPETALASPAGEDPAAPAENEFQKKLKPLLGKS